MKVIELSDDAEGSIRLNDGTCIVRYIERITWTKMMPVRILIVG